MQFISRLLISALSLGFAAYIVPGMHVDGLLTLLLAAFVLGIVNAIVRPVLVFFTLPLTLLSLGLFLFVINAAMFGLAAWLIPGFAIDSFWAALMGWLLCSLTSWAATQVFGGLDE